MSALPKPALLSPVEIIRAYLDALDLRAQARSIGRRRVEKAQHYLQDFVRFCPVSIAEFDGEILTRWLLAHPRWKSPSTKCDAIGAVMAAFRWAVRRQHLAFVPFLRPEPCAALRPQPRAPTLRFDYRKLIRATKVCRGRRQTKRALRCAVRFVFRTGCRTCEMRLLLWSDIQWAKGIVVLRHHKTERTGIDRMFAMDDRILAMLRCLQKAKRFDPRPCRCELFEDKGVAHKIEDHVFLNSWGTPWDRGTFGSTFKEYAIRAGLDPALTAYGLRHGWCVQAIESGDCTDREIANQLGWGSTTLVHHYGRAAGCNAQHLRRIVSKANGRGGMPLFDH